MAPLTVAVASESELENAIADLARQRAQALVVTDDALFYLHRVRIMDAALRYGVATLGEDTDMLAAGAMLT